MEYTLFNIHQTRSLEILATGTYLSELILAGKEFCKIYPDAQFGITDRHGDYIWTMRK